MERYKFYYELSKKSLDEEIDRYRKLDEKAAKFLNILSISIVGYTALINASRTMLTSTHGVQKWIFISLIVLTYLALLSAWYRIFNAIKLAKIPRIIFDRNTKSIIEDEDMLTIYDSFATRCQKAIVDAQATLTEKGNTLIKGL